MKYLKKILKIKLLSTCKKKNVNLPNIQLTRKIYFFLFMAYLHKINSKSS